MSEFEDFGDDTKKEESKQEESKEESCNQCGKIYSIDLLQTYRKKMYCIDCFKSIKDEEKKKKAEKPTIVESSLVSFPIPSEFMNEVKEFMGSVKDGKFINIIQNQIPNLPQFAELTSKIFQLTNESTMLKKELEILKTNQTEAKPDKSKIKLLIDWLIQDFDNVKSYLRDNINKKGEEIRPRQTKAVNGFEAKLKELLTILL